VPEADRGRAHRVLGALGQRSVELGDCVCPYGSGCSHEHACIRCDFLPVQPAAEQLQAWPGDVEHLRVTLDQLHDK